MSPAFSQSKHNHVSPTAYTSMTPAEMKLQHLRLYSGRQGIITYLSSLWLVMSTLFLG